MRLSKRIWLAVAGVALGLAAGWYTFNPRGAPGSGVTLTFEMVNPAADMSRELESVKRRLAVVSSVQVARESDTRLRVLIPYAPALIAAEAARDAAMDDFRKTEMTPARLDSLLQLPPARRTAEIDRIAPEGTPQRVPLLKLAAAFDKETAARQEAATSSAPAARATAVIANDLYYAARDEFYAHALDYERFTRMLEAADDPRQTAAQEARDGLLALYPAQAVEILHAIEARKAWRAAGGGIDVGPDLILRLLAPSTLDFRIAITELPSADIRAAAASLHLHGPTVPVKVGGSAARWCEIAPGSRGQFDAGALILESWAGRPCVLCCEDHEHTLTHRDPQRAAWTVSARPPLPTGDIGVSFQLDATGGKYMGDLTAANLNRPLVLLVDDQAINVSTIKASIGQHGLITFEAPTPARPAVVIRREAQALATALNMPELPSPLRRIR
jgi:hypothetical protein